MVSVWNSMPGRGDGGSPDAGALAPGVNLDRRRFVELAAGAVAGVTLVGLPTPAVAEAEGGPVDDPSDMGHYSSSPRRGYVVIHHTGGSNNHTIETNEFCNFSGGNYDFAVTRQGKIFVCYKSAGNPMWKRTSGEHALGCNCRAIGIVMHGCFGGCDGGNVSGPSSAQKCSVALLIAHLETPDEASRIRPHAACVSWNPCGGGTATVCPGTNFTSGGTSWNSNGKSLRDQLRGLRRNWDRCGNCSGEPCSA